MKAKEIIEALQEYFNGRENDEVDMGDIGMAFFTEEPDNKEWLIDELEYYQV